MTAEEDISDRIPVQCEHRGVGVHIDQPPERVAVVKAAIDEVYALTNPSTMMAFLESSANPPEARLFAAARLRAAHELAAESRIGRPKGIDLSRIHACCAGLDSLRWRDPRRYTSLIDPHNRSAVLRETPLA